MYIDSHYQRQIKLLWVVLDKVRFVGKWYNNDILKNSVLVSQLKYSASACNLILTDQYRSGYETLGYPQQNVHVDKKYIAWSFRTTDLGFPGLLLKNGGLDTFHVSIISLKLITWRLLKTEQLALSSPFVNIIVNLAIRLHSSSSLVCVGCEPYLHKMFNHKLMLNRFTSSLRKPII